MTVDTLFAIVIIAGLVAITGLVYYVACQILAWLFIALISLGHEAYLAIRECLRKR